MDQMVESMGWKMRRGLKRMRNEVLSIRDLRMKFNQRYVLNGIDLDVREGEMIGYIGPNGAGKSTTVKILLGLTKGYMGTVRVFGEDIDAGSYEYKRRIGYVPEVAELYDQLTASEYLTFTGELYGLSADDADSKARQLMECFELEKVYHSRIATFSKGMRQKVLLISSLLHDPDLLFLDEPLSGLDANSVMVVKEILALLSAQGKTIFYSSHIMDVVEKISSRIILLADGRIAADGTFQELQQQSSEGTLEEVFNQLTGFHEHASIAQRFVSIVREGD